MGDGGGEWSSDGGVQIHLLNSVPNDGKFVSNMTIVLLR